MGFDIQCTGSSDRTVIKKKNVSFSKNTRNSSINILYRILLTGKLLDNGDIVLINLGDHDIYKPPVLRYALFACDQ